MIKTVHSVIAAALVAAALATATFAAASFGPTTTQALAVTATVPNMFARSCSHVTRRCTGYRQTNGPYNPRVPSRYTTNWCWCWI